MRRNFGVWLKRFHREQELTTPTDWPKVFDVRMHARPSLRPSVNHAEAEPFRYDLAESLQSVMSVGCDVPPLPECLVGLRTQAGAEEEVLAVVR